MNKTHLVFQISSNFIRNNFSLLLILSLFSCSNHLEDKLTGTWKGSDFLFVRTSGPELVATINGGLGQHVNSRLILNQGRTFQKLVGEYDNGKGTWQVNGDQLITKGENGDEFIYTIINVTENELIMRYEVKVDTPRGELVGKITLSYSR